MAHGGITHIELPTPDIAASRRFYEKIFAWQVNVVPGWETYAMFTTPDGQAGGFSSGPQAERPSAAGPILHVEVCDMDATLSQIAAAGGKILTPKTKISDEFGFFALFLDNVGNRLGLWSRS